MAQNNSKTSMTQQEIDFCDLLVFGCDPYAGDARRCYKEVFQSTDNDKVVLCKAKKLMNREDVKQYLAENRTLANYDTADMKTYLTEKLKRICEETSVAVYTDRKGHELSPAALRSVSVAAMKALMELYPVKVAQESKVELKGSENGGIIFNVIAPATAQEEKKDDE